MRHIRHITMLPLATRDSLPGMSFGLHAWLRFSSTWHGIKEGDGMRNNIPDRFASFVRFAPFSPYPFAS